MRSSRTDYPLLAAAFLLAACSLAYELLIAQIISVFAGNTVVWYSLTIGIFLVGMGVGAVFVGPLLQRYTTTVVLFWTESALCMLGALSPFLLHIASLSVLWGTVADEWVTSGSAFFVPAIGMALAIGFFTGIELPLLMQYARERDGDGRRATSAQLLAADYFGSLAGALAFSLLLWPNLEAIQIGPAVAAINLLTAIFLAASPQRRRGFRTRAVCAGVSLGMLVCLLATNRQFMEFFLRRYYAYSSDSVSFTEMLFPSKPLPRVARRRSAYHTIDLVQAVHHDRGFYVFDLYSSKLKARPSFPPRYLLFLNGEIQFFADFEEVYHEFFAHVPVAAFETVPKRVLVLGGGDGLLLRELLKYSEIESISLVDLDPAMIDFARSNPIMHVINNRAFEDQRVDLVIGDAYHFVRTTNQTFDAVFMDFPEISDYNLARLYSSEFYHFVLQRLSRDGFAVMNAGGIEYLSIPDEAGVQRVGERNQWPSLYETFKAAGFQTVVPYYSQLEYKYPDAMERAIQYNLMSLPQGVARARQESSADLFLRYHTASRRAGFVLLSREKRQLASNFNSGALPLYVINDSRYRAALNTPLQNPPEGMLGTVNSVFRPRPSKKPLWSIRRPLRVYKGVFAQ